MHNFPTKLDWLLIIILWIPTPVANFGNPAFGWIGLLIVAGLSLVIAYVIVYALDVIADKIVEFAKRSDHGDA